MSTHVHNLERIGRRTHRKYFPLLRVNFAWGRDVAGVHLKSIRLGSYDRGLVRVHARLDDARVPEWFIEFVVYHELVHATLSTHLHTREFRSLEAKHPKSSAARAWRAAHIKSVLSAAWREKR